MIEPRKYARLPEAARKKNLAEVLSVHKKKKLDRIKLEKEKLKAL